MSSPPFTEGNFTPENIDLPEDNEELLVKLKKILEEHARFLNRKDTGTYETVEQQNNQSFPGATPQAKRTVFRKLLEFGAIGVGGNLIIPHGVVGITRITRLYGTFLTATEDRPLPYADEAVVTNQVSLRRNGINVIVVNGATGVAIVSGIVVMEFYKN